MKLENTRDKDLIFVTAADTKYFRALTNCVGSIHHWHPEAKILLYDLGLKDPLLDEIEHWNNVTLIKYFTTANNIPEHCGVLTTYAWKPFVIVDSLVENEAVLWTDVGSDIRYRIDQIRDALNRDGHFFVQGQDVDMTLLSHESTYLYLGLKKENFTGLEHFAGGLQGYLKSGTAYKDILLPLREFASKVNCIAPPDSNLSNHRFDQTLLSILIYQSGLDIVPQTQFLAASRDQLNRNPFLKSNRLVYTARGSSCDYSLEVRGKNGYYLYRNATPFSAN